MEPSATQNPKHTKLKTTLDIISAISLVVFFIILPIWVYFVPEGRDANGHTSLPVKVALINLPFFLFGGVWLLVRYSSALIKKYPFIGTKTFRLLFKFGIPFLILLSRVIWRW